MSAASGKGKKRRRSTSVVRTEKEEADGEPSARLTSTDLMCPICFGVFNEVYVTPCGHSFCYKCIVGTMELPNQQCPVCKSSIPGVSSLHPNFYLNDVVAKYKSRVTTNKGLSLSVAEILDMTTHLSPEESTTLIRGIAERSQDRSKKEEDVNAGVALHFVSRAINIKEKELKRLKNEVDVLHADRERLTAMLKRVPEPHGISPINKEVLQAVVPSLTPPTSNSSTSSMNIACSSNISQRNVRVDANFGEILEDYLSIKLPTVGEPPDEAQSLKQFCDGLHKFTQFRMFKELASLTYGEPSNKCCIVSSIEFDRDGEYFAVAGVTKKIKVFEYESVVRNAAFTNHFPVQDMSCAAKLSCVAYNPYHKYRLVSSDYEGSVCVWDTNVGQKITLYQEHSHRVWSVAYNSQEPSLFASGSDDHTVKLWSTGQPNSIFSLSAKANICSVKFNPYNRYLLAYGSADHGVHYVDLRNPKKPLLELGHKKAVSYVNFLGPNELVSASTDSELKCWHTEHGVCMRTYRGHTNDKNFVGLTVTPDFIACGSENNAVYVYAKQVSSPMLTYQYNTPRGLLASTASGDAGQSPELNEFVSAVSWRGSTNILLAANSHGHIKVLEMSQ